MRRRGLAAILAIAALNAGAVNAQETAGREPKWYDGLSITPGIGLRHFALHVDRGSDNGSLSNSIQNSFFYALDVQSPSLQFNDSWGASLYAYTSNVKLSEQFSDDDGGDSNTGNTYDVGTRGSGRYSYLVPALHFSMPAGTGEMRFALGYGTWFADVSGDIILTPDNRPARGMPTTDFDVRVKKQAYLFHMQWRTAGSWHFGLSVGGPQWREDGMKFQVEEVSLVVGYAITPRTLGFD